MSMYLFIESFTIVFVLDFGSFSSAGIDPTCDWFSEETMASLVKNNSTMQEFGSETWKLEEYPRLRYLELYRNRFPSSVAAESQLLERAIFEYIRNENVRDVIMLYNEDSDGKQTVAQGL
ncbi:hypothetical protein AVEN_251596-1 [Araneus ventricosus]|uniref:Uncharacterized protein n=1 Tax=Araneus ventricosus TaxID=182803 RepID=A0A4Y2WB49_ARAVE|nr:hypothetical protein AVEN_251596-1 [Araneus ventricosus]